MIDENKATLLFLAGLLIGLMASMCLPEEQIAEPTHIYDFDRDRYQAILNDLDKNLTINITPEYAGNVTVTKGEMRLYLPGI